jgi:hypothetical protein
MTDFLNGDLKKIYLKYLGGILWQCFRFLDLWGGRHGHGRTVPRSFGIRGYGDHCPDLEHSVQLRPAGRHRRLCALQCGERKRQEQTGAE